MPKNYSGEKRGLGDGKNNSPLYMNFSELVLTGKIFLAHGLLPHFLL